jgi:acetyl-CoA carboxylase biotin carboxyl carrier protein
VSADAAKPNAKDPSAAAAKEQREVILAAVDRLAPALAASGLDELEIQAGELRVRIARPTRTVDEPVAAAPAPVATTGAAQAPSSPYGDPAPGMRFVAAPLTGVWYSAPSPGARAYLEVGSEVAIGQVVGLIEAMKLFNEIKSDVSGTVTRFLVESGTLVKRQQPVLEVDPR